MGICPERETIQNILFINTSAGLAKLLLVKCLYICSMTNGSIIHFLPHFRKGRPIQKNFIMKYLSIIFIAFLCPAFVVAQDSVSHYNNQEIFDPTFFTFNGNEYRSASGEPGPAYWQNHADYEIHATLDEKDSLLKGNVKIQYINNSPDSLHYLWLQLDQNLFKTTSRGAATTPVSGDRFDVRGYDKGGYNIRQVSIVYTGKKYDIKPVITDTRMQLRLPFVIHPKGDQVSVQVAYDFSIPIYGADRMGRLRTKNGQVYELAQCLTLK